ncbi:uncharacterized protein EDB91DRAFT_1082662 [Suillus paluster]|uniref:uncharacterized protein n=1 Tax=Suillus paluster TaxID=48578 RepID=UPI001B85D7BE|nr:uncharacterized protein EDB91DRAFT_1082662 [Suillus paluster]KAG1738623.1 hypothetical protein EDB91DRAFT_1082662 [Suillus paluster]
MSFSFAAFTPPAPLDLGKDRILAEWKELEDRVIAEAKYILDGKEELQEEWRMWCECWADIMVSDLSIPFDTERYPSTSRERYPTALTGAAPRTSSLRCPVRARAAGLGANEQYERWTHEHGALEACMKDRESCEVQMGIDSPPARLHRIRPCTTPFNGRNGQVCIPRPPDQPYEDGGSYPIQVCCCSEDRDSRSALRALRQGEEKRSCNGCNTVHQKCEYASFGKAMGLKGKVLDAPTLSASASGSLRWTVSSPGLAVLSGTEPKGKGKGKVKEVVPATPTVEESSDEVSHYEKGKIAKVAA